MKRSSEKRNLLLLLLLLIAGAVCVWWFFFRGQAAPERSFTVQGNTKVKTHTPVLRIWDYSAMDGDTVNVFFDGKMIFENLAIDYTPVVYNPDRLASGKHWLGITAVSEGMMGPASPHISITDGKNVMEFDIDSYKDSTSGSWSIEVE